MKTSLTRRSFLKTSTACAAAGAILSSSALSVCAKASQGRFKGELKKSLYWRMLPKELTVLEKFQLIKEAGFHGVEIPTIEKPELIGEFKAGAESTGIEIHSIMNSSHWGNPLSSGDPKKIKIGMDGMKLSLQNAKELGADTVLLVPGVVGQAGDAKGRVSYKDAYERSQKYIRELLPLAKELDIVIGIENVWNKFLLSPLEFARYVDELDSPYLKAYFDVGNIMLYGYPWDWIRILGDRIFKVHIKGFTAGDEKLRSFCNIGDGNIDWIEVRQAFSDIEYSGYIGAELRSGDAEYIKDVSRRMDKIVAGQKIKEE